MGHKQFAELDWREKNSRLAKPCCVRLVDAARQFCSTVRSQSNCKRKELGPRVEIEDTGVSRGSRAELSPHEAASAHPHALFRVRQSESSRN
jgi:hypothetical protein